MPILETYTRSVLWNEIYNKYVFVYLSALIVSENNFHAP